jgi:hypothetical protein
MTISITDLGDPIAKSLHELRGDLTAAQYAVQPWTPTGPTLALGIAAGGRAVTALEAVVQALGDLQPGAALVVTEALERALVATR